MIINNYNIIMMIYNYTFKRTRYNIVNLHASFSQIFLFPLLDVFGCFLFSAQSLSISHNPF